MISELPESCTKWLLRSLLRVYGSKFMNFLWGMGVTKITTNEGLGLMLCPHFQVPLDHSQKPKKHLKEMATPSAKFFYLLWPSFSKIWKEWLSGGLVMAGAWFSLTGMGTRVRRWQDIAGESGGWSFIT